MLSIKDYYSNKGVLITGGTGLLGKVLIETILHKLPDIRRVYVLIRPRANPDGRATTPEERLWEEILNSTAFDSLREQQGEEFTALAKGKVEAIAGDLSLERFGLDDSTYQRLQKEVQIIINCAAVVSFDAPLDMAVRLNTLGPKRILEFAQGCDNPFVAHVSTCYVNPLEGPISEEPLDPTTTPHQLNGRSEEPYDVDREVKDIQEFVERINKESHSLRQTIKFNMAARFSLDGRKGNDKNDKQGADAKIEPLRREWVNKRLVAAGIRWAHRRGWNDTYTFTKGMGEQMFMRYRGNIPSLILRPSIIESALKTPAPGWLDGYRMLDPLIITYGRGRLPDFPGNPNGILDIIPADMTVNALLAAIRQAHEQGGTVVYQVASGMENPLTLRRFADLVQGYFQRVPLVGQEVTSKALPQITFPSTKQFLRRLRYRYVLPLRAAEGLAIMTSVIPRQRRSLAKSRSRLASLERLSRYALLYGPYAETKAQYQTHHLKELWKSLSTEEQEIFDFNIGDIDWHHYIQDIHIPGIKLYLLGIPREASISESAESDLFEGKEWSPDVQEPDEEEQSVTSGSQITGEEASEGSSKPSMVEAVSSESVQGGVTDHSTTRILDSLSSTVRNDEVERWARSSLFKRAVRSITRGLVRQSFKYILGFHCEGLEHIPEEGPFIVAANHTSHLDTGALLSALGHRAKYLHPVAATDYWFRNRLRGWTLRTALSVIPFDRQAHMSEALGLPIEFLRQGHSLIFFPEGGRSISGKIQPFKSGIGVLALASGAPIVPAHIHGTFQALPKGRSILKRHQVRVRFGPPINVEPYLKQLGKGGISDLARSLSADVQQAVEALDGKE